MSKAKIKEPELTVINKAIATALSIVNSSKEEHIQDMAVDIADSLIAITNVPDL